MQNDLTIDEMHAACEAYGVQFIPINNCSAYTAWHNVAGVRNEFATLAESVLDAYMAWVVA